MAALNPNSVCQERRPVHTFAQDMEEAPAAPMSELERRAFWRALLADPAPLPEWVQARLRKGARAYADGGDWAEGVGLTIDSRRPGTQLAREERVEALVDAFAVFSASFAAAASNWRRCDAFGAAIGEFEAREWPAWQSSGAPEDAPLLGRALFRARSAGEQPLPRSARALFDLLTRAAALT